MEECFPTSMLVVAGLLRAAGASRNEPWSNHTTVQSSWEEGLGAATNHLVPIREDDATQVTLQLDSFTSDLPNDSILHLHETIRIEAEALSKDGQTMVFPDRQPRRSELSFSEGLQRELPSTDKRLISRSMLGDLPTTEAKSASQPALLTSFLTREDGMGDATGQDLSISEKQPSLTPTKAVEMDLLATLRSEPLESAGQRVTTDSSPPLDSSPVNPYEFILGKGTAEVEVVLGETKFTPEKEGLTLVPTGSQGLLASNQQMQLDLRTPDLPRAPGFLSEAQPSHPSQQGPLLQEHTTVQQPDFASFPHGKMKRQKAVGLGTVEHPALLTPSQNHTHFSPLLLTPGILFSRTPPQSAMPEDASQSGQLTSVHPSRFPPSSKPDVSNKTEKHLQESRHLTLQTESDHQMIPQKSRFNLSQITAALRDSLSLSKVQGTPLEASVPTQEQLQRSSTLVPIYGKAERRVPSPSPLVKTTSSSAHHTTLHVAASSHIQLPLPAMLDADEHVTEGTARTRLSSTFPSLVHRQQLSLSTSAPFLTESEQFALSSASFPTQPSTPGISATVNAGPARLGTLAPSHTVQRCESELSTGLAASVHTKLPTPGILASASAATDFASPTRRPAGLPILGYGELGGRALGMPFQARDQILDNSVSAHSRPAVPETMEPSHIKAAAAATGLNVLGTAVHDLTKPKLLPNTSSPSNALTQTLPIKFYTRLQPATPSMPAPGPQEPVFSVTVPTLVKLQKPGAPASFIKEPQSFITPVHARSELVEGNLPVSAEANVSIPANAKAPLTFSVHAQTQHRPSQASAQLRATPLGHSGTKTTNTPASSPAQLLGHSMPPLSSTSASVQTESLPPAASASPDAATWNPRVHTDDHPNRQLPTGLALPGMLHTTAEGKDRKGPQPSSLPPSQLGIHSTPLPDVSAVVPSQRAGGGDRSSGAPSLGSPAPQTAQHRKADLPILSSVRRAGHFPGSRTTPRLVRAGAQGLVQSSPGFLLHLLNQSDVTEAGNLDSAVASSYLGISSSVPYLSFLIRSTENMICLQPSQNYTPPPAEPNVSGQEVASFLEMLISSAFLGLSHLGVSSLIQMSPSSVFLVKPVFAFLPADDPEGRVPQSAEEEKEHVGRHLFTKAAVLDLVVSSHERLAESNPTIRQTTRTHRFPTNRRALPGSTLSALPEGTTGPSLVSSTTLKVNPFPNGLREVATTQTKSLPSKDREGGLWPFVLGPTQSGENNTVSLSAERHASSTSPVVVSVHQRAKTLPSTTELLSSASRMTSLHSVAEHAATQMLARTSRSEDKPQPNTMPMLRAKNHPPGSMTSITSRSKNFRESLSTPYVGDTGLPLEVAKHLTPSRAASHSFLITKEFRKRPSENQHVPSTVSNFLTLSTVKNLSESAATHSSYSEAVTVLPRATETPSYFLNASLARVSKSHLFLPNAPRISERSKPLSSFTPFLAFTTLSDKHLEDRNLWAHSRPSASTSSQLSTNSYFATSALKDDQSSLMLTGRTSLARAEGLTGPTVSNEEPGMKVRGTETHNPTEARHSMPTMLGAALLFSTEFTSALASSGGTVGSTSFQPQLHRSPLTTLRSLSPSSTRKDITASPMGGVMPPLGAPYSDLLSVTVETNTVGFFSPSLIQNARGQKEVAAPLSTSSRVRLWPARLEGDHQGTARQLEYEQAQDSASSMPSPNSTSSSLVSSAVAGVPAFLETTLSSGVPSDGPVDQVLTQTSHLQSLPLDHSEIARSHHTQVLLTLESLSGTSETRAEGDFMVEATSNGELDESYLYTVEEQVTNVGDATEVAARDHPLASQQSASNSRLLDWKMYHRRVTRSDYVFLDGFATMSDDTCGSGNYSTEMSLYHAVGLPPSRPDNYLARIVLHSNSSRPTLRIKSCCVTPAAKLAGPDAACCLFPRSPLECRYIQLHQKSQPQAASFTIQLFQMLNRSAAYLHCELSICLSNHAGCEQNCSENRETRSKPTGWGSYQTLHNLISFGPVLQAEAESPSELAAGSDLDMVSPALLGFLAGIAILLGISIFVRLHQRHQIRRAEDLEGQGICTP